MSVLGASAVPGRALVRSRRKAKAPDSPEQNPGVLGWAAIEGGNRSRSRDEGMTGSERSTPAMTRKEAPPPLPWVSSCGGAGQSPARVHLRHAGFLSGYKPTLHHHVKRPNNDRPDHRSGSLLGRAGKLLVHYANQGRDGGKLFVLRICSEKGFRMMYENIDHC